MLILVEKDTRSNGEKLKDIASNLDRLTWLVNQLARRVAVIQLSESYLIEGTLEDRKFVAEKIQEIQAIVTRVDKIILVFETKDLSAPQEKQRYLKSVVNDIDILRNDMLALWEMRNSGDTPEDNTTIQNITGILFGNVNGLLKKLKKYVDDFNAASHVKLTFNVKWTPLPK
jgi:hypothetical protein